MILHVDGDAFFASVEQSVKPWLKGKPVVTGKERNIVAAASYEAKAMGVKRGVTLWDAKKMCPGLVVLPTDYETVSLYSKRMYDIVRKYTPTVEEYSVDECFADLKGLRRLHHASYEAICHKIQEEIHASLGITVTLGLAHTKTLCKIAVEKVKPAGFKSIHRADVDTELQGFPVEEIWGVGPATAHLLKKFGMPTALQFKNASEERIKKLLTKPGIQTWQELNGIQAITFEEEKTSYQSIGKSKTFTPPSDDKEYVFAQLMKNIENATMKARRYHQATKKIVIYLRSHDFKGTGIEATLERATAYPNELAEAVRAMFEKIHKPIKYRATGVYLTNLTSLNPIQPTLFEEPAKITKLSHLYGAIDTLREKYGKHSVHLATTLNAQSTQHLTRRGDIPQRNAMLLKGENKRQRLPLPMLQVRLR
ncbi:MAG: DNA polymerase IV [Candidatus Andersenbacteria bacterium]